MSAAFALCCYAQDAGAGAGTGDGSSGSGTDGSANALHDPGVRTGTIDAGQPFGGLNDNENDFFTDGKARFVKVDNVAAGLGPTFNSNSCGSCHSQPAIGGTSPNENQFPFVGVNPQSKFGTSQFPLPSFVTTNGPVLEARFKFFVNANGAITNTGDNGVHDLFVITGMNGAGNCNISPPNFAQMQQLNNVSFRIPTPVFGVGLIETITEEAIITNMKANAAAKSNYGIAGIPNRSGNDGTITRFGWKAQNKSGQVFAGEAYNVEMGVTNELFGNERGNSSINNASGDPPNACLLNPIPEDSTNFDKTGDQIPSDVVEFSHFMRFLDQPAADSSGIPGNPPPSSISNGHTQFENVGCNLCHTESLTTGKSSFDQAATTPFLSNQTAHLYSDLLVHHMGGLADGITQGLAQGDQFRTAPLWGVGQRIFFLHDGRATPGNGGLLTAIRDHNIAPVSGSGFPTSEAATSITQFNALSVTNAQDLLNFLRSL